jgi:hypothetical protein
LLFDQQHRRGDFQADDVFHLGFKLKELGWAATNGRDLQWPGFLGLQVRRRPILRKDIRLLGLYV